MAEAGTETATTASETQTEEAPRTETVTSDTTTGETPESTTTPSAEDTNALKAQLEKIQAQLKKANAEAAAHRVEAKELRAFKEQAETEKLSAQEKQEKRLADLQKQNNELVLQYQEARLQSAVQLQAVAMNFHDPEDALTHLRRSEIDYGEDGKPTNVADLLANLIKNKPYLVRQTTQPPRPTPKVDATAPARSTTSANGQALSWEYIGSLKPTDWSAMTPARQQEISRWMNDPKNRGRRRA